MTLLGRQGDKKIEIKEIHSKSQASRPLSTPCISQKATCWYCIGAPLTLSSLLHRGVETNQDALSGGGMRQGAQRSELLCRCKGSKLKHFNLGCNYRAAAGRLNVP